MKFSLLCLGIFAAVLIVYFVWKSMKYMVYHLSHAAAKGFYEAQDSVVAEKEKAMLIDIPQIDKFNPNAQEHIRRDWLRSYGTFVLGNLALVLGCYFYIANWGVAEVAWEILVEDFGNWLLLVLSSALMFFFAYVKFGTRWVGWFIFVSPVTILLTVIKDIVDTFTTPDLTIAIVYYISIMYLFRISFYVDFWIHCKRLYDLNRAIKKRKSENEDSKLEPIPTV